jgi:prophage DNA circulation protein
VQDVLQLRDELIEQMDDKAESASSDTLYYSIVDVRTAMVTDLQTRAAALASLIPLVLPESAPTLVVAYDLYEDATRDADIIVRNVIRDPNFSPSGRALQVFSDV